MRLLFDQNLSFRLCRLLRDVFPASSQVRTLGLDGADDRSIWRRAKADGYIIVSHDVDFAEMASLVGPPPKVLWLRTGNRPTDAIERLLRRHAARIQSFACDPEAACLELY